MCRAMGARPMDVCRIGLIGAGNVGRRHAQVLRSFPDVHLVGITDVVPEAAAETAERVGAQVAAAGVLTAVGHHWRYLKVVERARRLLDGRAVRLVGGTWLDKVPPVGWWPVRDRSGGPVIEQAAHVLDLARYLVGEVSQVSAVGSGTPPAVPGADIDGSTVATLRFAGGAIGTIAATCVLGWKERAG